MQSSTHSDFICSPISKILKEAVSASIGIGSGIETFPLCEYVMQSIFIKMTGFQEQKMKCICWDIASIDFEYRYEFTRKPLGECSSYNDKNAIYKDLIKLTKKNDLSIDKVFPDKENLIKLAANEVIDTFNETNLSIWAQAAFLEFPKIKKTIKKNHIASETELFNCSNLKIWYVDYLYRHRNRIAHNTSSYQQNLPTLKTLMNEKHKYENYFLFFFILILIDKIFIKAYRELLNAINEKAD